MNINSNINKTFATRNDRGTFEFCTIPIDTSGKMLKILAFSTILTPTHIKLVAIAYTIDRIRK